MVLDDDLLVLLVAPTGRDADLIKAALSTAGMQCEINASTGSAAERVRTTDLGALLIAEEALSRQGVAVLKAALATQPAWSDVPVVILTFCGKENLLSKSKELERLPLGNAILLERPIRVATLISSLNSALRARARQYDVRSILEQRDRAEESLRNAEERLRLALQTARLGTWQLDVEAGTLTVSSTFRRDFDFQEDSILTYAMLLSRVHPDDRDAMEACIRSALELDIDYRTEYRVVWADESVHWIYSSGRCISVGGEQPQRMVGVTLDITERVLSEMALRRNEKLALVGRLASSIAHEINNPLESITNLLFLVEATDLTEEQRSYLSIAQQELKRVSEISLQTLSFNKQRDVIGSVQISDLLESVLALYQGRLTNSGITVERRFQGTAPFLCYPGELRQVFTNLIGNAFDATRKGGSIFVRERYATDVNTGRRGRMVTMADTGEGIKEHVKPRLFEAFNSSKGNNGTGLGLWISKSIVEKHSGYIRYRSSTRPGRSGSVFKVFLPESSAAHSELGPS